MSLVDEESSEMVIVCERISFFQVLLTPWGLFNLILAPITFGLSLLSLAQTHFLGMPLRIWLQGGRLFAYNFLPEEGVDLSNIRLQSVRHTLGSATTNRFVIIYFRDEQGKKSYFGLDEIFFGHEAIDRVIATLFSRGSWRVSHDDIGDLVSLSSTRRSISERVRAKPWLVSATFLGIASFMMVVIGVICTMCGWVEVISERASARVGSSAEDFFNGSVALLVGGLCCAAASVVLIHRPTVPRLGTRPWYLFLVALLPLGIGIRPWQQDWLWEREAAVAIALVGVCLVIALLKNWAVHARLGLCLTLVGLGCLIWIIEWGMEISPHYRELRRRWSSVPSATAPHRVPR